MQTIFNLILLGKHETLRETKDNLPIAINNKVVINGTDYMVANIEYNFDRGVKIVYLQYL